MPDVQEVFRMATQKVRPEPGFVDRQQDHQRRRQRNRKLGAFAVAAAIGLAAVALFLGTRGGQPTSTPATQPPPTLRLVDPTAGETASSFVQAFGQLNADRALTFVADGADITRLTGTGSSPSDLRQIIAWLDATGFTQYRHGPCVPSTSSFASGTTVSCSFEFEGLRSGELGFPAFSGSSIDVTVQDGEVVQASLNWETEKFSPKVWEPFATWVSKHYPQDAAVMYEDDTHSVEQHSNESIRLWERHTREYVQHEAATS
jgi:hypothetical protein